MAGYLFCLAATLFHTAVFPAGIHYMLDFPAFRKSDQQEGVDAAVVELLFEVEAVGRPYGSQRAIYMQGIEGNAFIGGAGGHFADSGRETADGGRLHARVTIFVCAGSLYHCTGSKALLQRSGICLPHGGKQVINDCFYGICGGLRLYGGGHHQEAGKGEGYFLHKTV